MTEHAIEVVAAAQPPAPWKREAASRRSTWRPGVEVEMDDDEVWTFGSFGLAEGFRAERDMAYAAALTTEEVPSALIDTVACASLWINYDVPPEQIRAIVADIDRRELVELVMSLLVPLVPRVEAGTFTTWARTALIANGIEPEAVAAHEVAGVLDHLVRTGRAVPHAEFTEAGRAHSERAGLLGAIGQ